MSKILSTRATSTRATSSRGKQLQAFTLIGLGILSLLGALLLHLNPFTYPLGLLLFGLGMLIAALFNPYRLLIAGIMVTLLGLSIFTAFKPIIPNGGSTLYIAIALGLFGVALAARRGYVGKGTIMPAIIVLIVSLIEYPLTFHLFPANVVPFVLSLWFPGIGLLVLGVIYWFMNSKQ